MPRFSPDETRHGTIPSREDSTSAQNPSLQGQRDILRYENLAKIKNRRPPLPPISLLDLAARDAELWSGRLEKRRRIAVCEHVVGREGRRVRGQGSGMRYKRNALRPHFSEDHLLNIPACTYPYQWLALIPRLSWSRCALSPFLLSLSLFLSYFFTYLFLS